MDFTIKKYKELLKALMNMGFEFQTFERSNWELYFFKHLVDDDFLVINLLQRKYPNYKI